MKNILVINANPKSSSFNKALSHTYATNASGLHNVRTVHIGDLEFDLNLKEGYETTQILEPDLNAFQQNIQWADHIVIVSPVWWGSVPAKFKGVIDRVFLPGFAFKYNAGKAIPEKLLTGKTSELIVTMDTPVWWYRFVQGNVVYKHLNNTILSFAGIKNTAVTYFGPVINSKPKQRERWLEKTQQRAKAI